jgi:uncharacterized OB-fold protein
MHMPDLLKPNLYRREGSESLPSCPALLGGECDCGYVFFPFQSYGCERCGRTNLRKRALTGRGKLLASARVHLHASKTREAPFTVGAITLDDGPIVRTLLVDDDKPFRPGDTVVTMLAAARDADGNEKLDLRFQREA